MKTKMKKHYNDIEVCNLTHSYNTNGKLVEIFREINIGFKKDSMAKIYLGKTIEQAAQMRNQSPEDAIIDLIIEDDSRIQCIYFSMSEENIRKKVQIPWLSSYDYSFRSSGQSDYYL